MRNAYRCSRCRSRNLFRKHPDAYVRPRSCSNCGYQRFYIDKGRWYRVSCRCDGGYAHPHRPRSPLCTLNPRFLEQRALQLGCDRDDIAWHGLAGRVVAPGEPIPF